jgi:hypothetical protein
MTKLIPKPFVAVTILVLASLLAGACAAAPTATPLPPTAVAATATPSASQATATTAPTSTLAPTASPAPTATLSPTSTTPPTATAAPTAAPTATTAPTAVAPTRISFAPGGTSAVVEGNLPLGGSVSYVVQVTASQLMEVDVSPDQGLALSITGADGEVLKGAAGAPFFRGTVPTTQDYILTLRSVAGATPFTLEVIIPARISFALGTTSEVVQGHLAANLNQYYVLKVAAGQLLEVDTTSLQSLTLSVYGVDGTVLLSGMGDESSFRGTVPTTQDYILVLVPVNGATDFTINVVIALHISFTPGATSAVVQGILAAHGVQYYAIQAAANQLIEVSATPENTVGLTIYGVDGTVLKNTMSQGAFFRGYLPVTQDYIIVLSGASSAMSYSLSVIIPARISFAAGATSAEVSDNLAAHGAQYYIIKALAGQLMQVNVTSSQAVRLSIYGVDGTVLKSGMGEGATFAGTLPSTQDYILVVGAGTLPSSYTLIVSIQ